MSLRLQLDLISVSLDLAPDPENIERQWEMTSFVPYISPAPCRSPVSPLETSLTTVCNVLEWESIACGRQEASDQWHPTSVLMTGVRVYWMRGGFGGGESTG
ncbi:hypothetical protein FA13DRAFT_1733418 [Coprinellus micaceus]|uniref:Uncharacterized protein n=1 Tax=Coprinellus micaceus TaxID=71717 RepID=A0A4Y7T8S3_COPMI|nr:hypothetical protein FA13DRAFT_1733418 [Coprinellus micaceus]